ncbi:glycosyltransferase family 39 protein [Patescibacteria group bacterium]|nr:glycosyltransferase family 39 protein [Patescibacteria group bacterium]MCL5010041.1 glycosyltransferase family 39 protein [Patescibacteria group bacterium]
MKKYYLYILFVIVLLGLCLRLYDINWDQGFHLHPDERAIVMFTLPLHLPHSFKNFFSPRSSLDPHFFAYGSFPLYLLKVSGGIAGIFLGPAFRTYQSINLVGRFLSSVFDGATILIIFLLAKKLFDKRTGLLAAFFYSIALFPIQVSHFYAVDTILSFFILVTLYSLINFYEKPSLVRAVVVGFFFGLSLATKVSAMALLPALGMSLIIDFLLIFFKSPHRVRVWFPHLPKFLKKLIVRAALIAVSASLTFMLFEPYALIDFKTFSQQTLEQYRMTHNAFAFPYTLQYVGKIPYLYEIKNIFLFGLGPIFSTLSFIGAFYFTVLALRKEKGEKWAGELILAVFFWSYFLVVGRFAIGFMRYMLPLYPLLALFAAISVAKIFDLIKLRAKSLFIVNTLCLMLCALLLIWPISFFHIYTRPNTRVLASNWINKHIPKGSILAVEHWDDELPLFGGGNYRILTLALYDPDTPFKWEKIDRELSQTQYIIIASNRLYVPLQKLSDCAKLYPHSCYPQTANYYRRLFSGKLGFKKVAEFSVYPTIPFLNIRINDQSADESFTVYDHPKVMIFKKSS